MPQLPKLRCPELREVPPGLVDLCWEGRVEQWQHPQAVLVTEHTPKEEQERAWHGLGLPLKAHGIKEFKGDSSDSNTTGDRRSFT